jgi:hypothetical protein
MHAMNRFKSVFLLSKFMLLFICVVSSIWFYFQCGFFFLSSAMGTRGGLKLTRRRLKDTYSFYSFFFLFFVFIQTESI